MKLRIISKPSEYLLKIITDDNVKVIDRWQVTAIEFENFCWKAGQFKGRYDELEKRINICHKTDTLLKEV